MIKWTAWFLFWMWLVVGNLQLGGAATATNKELLLLNWEEYFDPQVLALFEKRHGVKIKEHYFETDETRDEILAQTNGEKHDLVLVSSHKIEGYVKRGWLAPLVEEKIPNLKNVEKRWRGTHAKAESHAVPVFWGTLGIGYRRDLLGEEITSWQQLFRPDAKWHKKIMMIKDSGDLYGMALKYLGYSMNSDDPAAIEAAEKLLMEQKPAVRTYGYMPLTEESGLVTGSTAMAMVYNGDAITLQKLKPEIAFVAPKEGTNLWVDSMAILEKSPRRDLAHAFINFLHEPEVAAKMAQFANFATVNGEGAKLLPKEFLSNPTIYPPAEVLERSEFSRPFPPKVARKINSGFNRLIH
ncbi:MAG: spermidine/putrescine ABC transporter substrate-binding protein [Magnetococcales bacterium]|nr:spermidine/putrescine ABC transporter substrate-binding protein [Magnetococcales bacterium]NGZ25790.1 spermidine/putrescine ABC transporter substrate-binding protein [Magnetococcales bacterium]